MRRAVRLLLLAMIAVGVLLLFVFPFRTLVDQRHQLSSTQRQITALTKENDQLSARIKSLKTPSQIEQIAHQDFGLVMKGQQSYTIIPKSSPTTTAPVAKTPAAKTPTTKTPTTKTPGQAKKRAHRARRWRRRSL
jgi:cell division protein FtsL